MSYTLDLARSIFPDTQVAEAIPATIEAYDRLSAEDQLALLWFAYTEVGSAIAYDDGSRQYGLCRGNPDANQADAYLKASASDVRSGQSYRHARLPTEDGALQPPF